MLLRSNDIGRRDPQDSNCMVQSDLRECYKFRLVGGKATHHRAVAMTHVIRQRYVSLATIFCSFLAVAGTKTMKSPLS